MQKNSTGIGSTGEAEISAKTLSETFEDTAEQMRRQFIEDLSGGLIKYYTWDMHKSLFDKKLEDLISEKKYEEALALIKELSEKFPQDKTYFGKAAEIYRRQKNYAMALEMCEKNCPARHIHPTCLSGAWQQAKKWKSLKKAAKAKRRKIFLTA